MRRYFRSIVLPEEGLLSLIFLAGVILSSVLSLEAAGWVENLSVLIWLAAGGLLCGLLLAKTAWAPAGPHILSLLLGTAAVAYSVAQTLSGLSLRANLMQVWARLDRWLIVTAGGGISTDNLLFLLLLAGIVWLVSYYGAWSVFRARGPWWPILTSGSLLVVNLSYARSLDVFALVYLLSAMLLVVRLNVAVQEDGWRRSGVQYSSDFVWHLIRSSILVGAVVVLAVWLAPSNGANQHLIDTWTRMSGPWQGLEARFSRMFGGLQAKDQTVTSGFGKTLALRGASALADVPVLAQSGNQARYLRGIVFDRYTGQGWLAPDRAVQQMLPNGSNVPEGSLQLRAEVTTTVTVLQSRGTTVLGPPQPVRLSVPAVADYDTFDDPLSPNGVADLSDFRSSVMQRQGQQYSVVSSVSIADVTSLRAAGPQYPGWVRDHYLSLPSGIPARVLTLARRVGGSGENAYDKAIAVQTYLRTFPYSTSVPGPPPGRDAVDFFLFDARTGYCDYYASAMVVMLRMLGVPARVVAGYSPGDYDPQQRAYIVRDSNAHSWPEVYFPKFGWVEFEPTASRPAPVWREQPAQSVEPLPTPAVPDNPEPDLRTPLEQLESPPASPGGLMESSGAWLRALGVIAAGLGVPALLYLGLGWVWRRRFSGLAAAEATYARMILMASWGGVRSLAHLTPHEYGRRLSALVPPHGSDIQLIVEQFVRHRFGRKPSTNRDEALLRAAWRRLRRQLLLRLIRRSR